MTDIAIRVDNPCPEFGRRISKLYPARSLAVWRPGVGWAGHLGAVHQRPDTTSTVLTHLRRRRLRPGSASLRDALTGFLPRISRKGKENSLNSPNTCTCLRPGFGSQPAMLAKPALAGV